MIRRLTAPGKIETPAKSAGLQKALDALKLAPPPSILKTSAQYKKSKLEADQISVHSNASTASGFRLLNKLKSKPYNAKDYADANATADKVLPERKKTKDTMNRQYTQLVEKIEALSGAEDSKTKTRLSQLEDAKEKVFADFSQACDKISAWEKLKRHIARKTNSNPN